MTDLASLSSKCISQVYPHEVVFKIESNRLLSNTESKLPPPPNLFYRCDLTY